MKTKKSHWSAIEMNSHWLSFHISSSSWFHWVKSSKLWWSNIRFCRNMLYSPLTILMWLSMVEVIAQEHKHRGLKSATHTYFSLTYPKLKRYLMWISFSLSCMFPMNFNLADVPKWLKHAPNAVRSSNFSTLFSNLFSNLLLKKMLLWKSAGQKKSIANLALIG